MFYCTFLLFFYTLVECDAGSTATCGTSCTAGVAEVVVARGAICALPRTEWVDNEDGLAVGAGERCGLLHTTARDSVIAEQISFMPTKRFHRHCCPIKE